MIVFKIKAVIIGFLLSLLPNKLYIKIVGGTKPKIGLDVVNSDYRLISKFKPEIIRINQVDLNLELIEYLKNNNIEYYIQIGRSSDSDESIAKYIIESDISLKDLKKPLFYSIVNEDNDFSWARIENVNMFIRIHYAKHINITKGSYTSIVESAALKKYKEVIKNKTIPVNMKHLIHFYLKPKNNIMDNLIREYTLRYLIYSLSRLGLKAEDIIISESHDASKDSVIKIHKDELRRLIKKDDGSFDGDEIIKTEGNYYLVRRYEGDFVFGSKEGWIRLEKLFKSLGVYAGLYYHEPFLDYKGNTVLESR